MRAEELSAARDRYHLLDVREPDEWVAGHIAGAQHIPLGQLRTRLAELPRERTIVAVCRMGQRSEAATRGLCRLGYACENLEGGVLAWRKAGFPLEADDGGPGRVV